VLIYNAFWLFARVYIPVRLADTLIDERLVVSDNFYKAYIEGR
jgi:hypothetical protein